jgi:hypothetical protein
MPTLSDFVKLTLEGHEINELTIGGKTVWVKPPSYRFKLVEYLSFFGDGYVDSRFIPETYETDGRVSISLTVNYIARYDTADEFVYMSGATDGTNYSATFLMRQYKNTPSNNTFGYYGGSKILGIYYPTLLGVRTTINGANNPTYNKFETFGVDGTHRFTEGDSAGSNIIGKPLYVGGCNGKERGMVGDIFECEIGSYAGKLNPYSPTTLRASMLPAVDVAGNLGMYDSIRDLFCRAYGTVTAGPETGEYIM